MYLFMFNYQLPGCLFAACNVAQTQGIFDTPQRIGFTEKLHWILESARPTDPGFVFLHYTLAV
jgi:hypothetical protein